MAKDSLKRLKFDNDTINACYKFIMYHDDRPPVTERNVRRAVSRIGADAFPDLFEIKRADVLGQSTYHREEKLTYIDEYHSVYEEICEKAQCVQKKDLAINGKDLIAMGMKPGKELGNVLEALFQQVLDEPELNQKEKLEELAHRIISN